MKRFLAVLIGIFILGSIYSVANAFNKAGFIFDDNGKKHWYIQTMEKKKYFHKILANTYTITFVEPTEFQRGSGSIHYPASDYPPMKNTDTNKMMINNVISKWYSHPDAAFQTKPRELYTSSALQKRGLCIQSKTYPIICIVVEYIVEDGYITKVHHAIGIGGCK